MAAPKPLWYAGVAAGSRQNWDRPLIASTGGMHVARSTSGKLRSDASVACKQKELFAQSAASFARSASTTAASWPFRWSVEA
jgi:hypothetical protein